jgi:uncharacterized protein YdeI (YjbR/CyaY-like superfamily)
VKKNVLVNQKTLYVTNREDWRAWLAKNFAKGKAIWLIFHKKHTGNPSITYADAVEESLCFGWIDSLVKRVDEDTYIQKFTPRKAKSTWSALNKKRVQKMIKLGRMTEAGLEKIEEAKRSGAWHKLDNIDELQKIPPDLAKALSADREARKNFKKMTPTSKKQFLWWIESAKREETRKNRIAKTVRLASLNRTLSDYYYGR